MSAAAELIQPVRQTAARFARERIAPHVARFEREPAAVAAIVKQALALVDDLGDHAVGAAVLEELGAACAGTAWAVLMQALAKHPVVLPGGTLAWGAGLAGGPVVRVLGLRAAAPGPASAGQPLDESQLPLVRLGAIAIAAGIARAAQADAERYAAERFQGGDRIGRLAVVRAMLDRSRRRADAAHQLCGELAAERDIARSAESAYAVATETAVEATTESLQVFGGYGYMVDFGLERRFRDAHALRLVVPWT